MGHNVAVGTESLSPSREDVWYLPGAAQYVAPADLHT